jgi:hypothetical protein
MKLINTISDYVRLRKLKRTKKRFEKDNRITLDEIEFFDEYDVDSIGPRERIAHKLWGFEDEIRAIETGQLRHLAEKWNIKLKKQWLDLRYTGEGKQLHLLTDEGVTSIKETIRKQRRENIEWWVTKVIVPVIGALTGLLGVILAFYALSIK